MGAPDRRDAGRSSRAAGALGSSLLGARPAPGAPAAPCRAPGAALLAARAGIELEAGGPEARSTGPIPARWPGPGALGAKLG